MKRAREEQQDERDEAADRDQVIRRLAVVPPHVGECRAVEPDDQQAHVRPEMLERHPGHREDRKDEQRRLERDQHPARLQLEDLLRSHESKERGERGPDVVSLVPQPARMDLPSDREERSEHAQLHQEIG